MRTGRPENSTVIRRPAKRGCRGFVERDTSSCGLPEKQRERSIPLDLRNCSTYVSNQSAPAANAVRRFKHATSDWRIRHDGYNRSSVLGCKGTGTQLD